MKTNTLMKIIIILSVIMFVEIILIAGFSIARADTKFVCVVHKGEWVWIRNAPAKEARSVDTIRYGVEGEIHEIVNGYARITANNGKKGWVDVSYLEIPIKEEVYVVNTHDPVNKRETPEGRYLTKIRGGSRISVLGWRYSKKGELWAKVFHGGYVKAEFLSKAE